MHFESLIDKLTSSASRNLKGDFSSRAFKKQLMDFLNVPSISDPEKFSEWLKSRDSLPEPFKSLANNLTTGSRSRFVDELTKMVCDPRYAEFAMSLDLTKQEKASLSSRIKVRMENVSKAVESVFSVISENISKFEKRPDMKDSSKEYTREEGKRFNARAMAKSLVEKIKQNATLDTFKSYVAREVQTNQDRTKLTLELLKMKEVLLVSFVQNVSLPTTSEKTLENFISARKENFFMDRALMRLKANKLDLGELLKNPKAAADRLKIPVEKIPELLKRQEHLVSKIVNFIDSQNFVGRSLELQKSNVNKLITEHVKRVLSNDKNGTMVYFQYQVRLLVSKDLREFYKTALNGILDPKSVDSAVYESVQKIISQQISSEEINTIDHFKFITFKELKDKNGKPVKIPVCMGDTSIIGDVKKSRALITIANEEKRKEHLENYKKHQLFLMAQQVRRIPSELLVRIKSVLKVNLGEVAYKKFEKNILDAKSFNEALNASKGKDGSKSIIDDQGRVLMNVIFEKALDEVYEKLKTRDGYSSTVHIRAVLQLAKLSGKFRSLYYGTYVRALQMESYLNKVSQKSGMDLDELLARPELSDRHEKDRSGDRPTRGARREIDYDELHEKKKRELEKQRLSIQKQYTARFDVFPKDFFDYRGRPVTSAVKQIYDNLLYRYNNVPSFRQLINERNPIDPAGEIRKIMTRDQGGVYRNILYNLRSEAIAEMRKNPAYVEQIKLLDKELYYERYLLAQKSLGFSAGFQRGGRNPLSPDGSLNEVQSEFIPFPTKRAGKEPDARAFQARLDVNTFEDEDNESSSDLVKTHQRKLPVDLQDKFQNMSLRGMVEASSSKLELDMVMNHIYDIVFTEDRKKREGFDSFQTLQDFEASADVANPITQLYLEKQARFQSGEVARLDNKANQRQQEIRGMENTPGTYPAS